MLKYLTGEDIMSEKFAPTRGNLVKLTSSVKMAKSGHDLLEQKRQVLMAELVRHIDKAKKLQSEMAGTFKEAYAALQNANMSLGVELVDDLAQAVTEADNIFVRFHSVMGVEIPDIDPLPDTIETAYSMRSSNASVDDAYLKFHKVLMMLIKLAEIETTVIRLAVHIRSTHRRVNALEKFVIPEQQQQMRFIADTLEEGDREDFIRMKMAQKR